MVRTTLRVVEMKPHPPRSGHSRRHKAVENKGITRTVKLVAAGLFCSLLYGVYNGASNPIAFKNTLQPVAVPTVDFNTLHHGRQEFGPLLTPTLECLFSHPDQVEETQSEVKRKGMIHITKDPIARYALQHGISHAGLESYLKHVQDLIPRHSAPLRVFPENLSAFFLNEYALVGNGESACKLTEAKFVDTDECNALIEAGYKYLEHQPEQKAQVAAQAETTVIGTLYTIATIDQETYTMRLGIDPGLHANYYRAIKKLEADWLQDSCFLNRPKEAIEASLLEIYRLLVDDEKAGYRDQEIVRIRHGKKLELANLESFSEPLQKDRGRLWFSSDAAVNNKWNDKDKMVDDFLFPEINLMEKGAHIPPKITRVPQEMMEFIAKLKEYAASDVHPAALAAWACSQVGRILPFYKYNDEFAWILVNAILQLGGFESVYIPNDEAFAIAFSKELDSPGHLAGYLASLIKTQSEGHPVFAYKL